jgi:hypothetical protein
MDFSKIGRTFFWILFKMKIANLLKVREFKPAHVRQVFLTRRSLSDSTSLPSVVFGGLKKASKEFRDFLF